MQDPQNKFTETNGTFAEFIDEYVKGVQRTMDTLGKLVGVDEDETHGVLPYHARYFHFLFQLLQYDPNAKEKLHNMAAADYAYWRAAIQQAKDSGELHRSGYSSSAAVESIRIFRFENNI